MCLAPWGVLTWHLMTHDQQPIRLIKRIILTGSTGNPLSPYYQEDDGSDAWPQQSLKRKNENILMAPGQQCRKSLGVEGIKMWGDENVSSMPPAIEDHIHTGTGINNQSKYFVLHKREENI